MVPPDPRPPAIPPSLGRELALTAKAVRAWADDAFARHGTSLTTWIVLQQAGADGTPPSQRELAQRMHIGGATLVRHIDRLEADGLVRRDPDPDDRRVTRISLTAAGRRHFEQTAAIATEIDHDLRTALTGREADVLRRALAKLRDRTAEPHRTEPDPTIPLKEAR